MSPLVVAATRTEHAPRARAGGPAQTRYWRRLREPDALMQRDLRLLATRLLGTPVADIGCGNGGFVAACNRYGIPAIGLEAFASSASCAAATGLPVIQAAGEHLPLRSSSLDAVRLKEVLEHVQEPLAMAREMHRVLTPNGIFIAYVPTQWSQLYPFPANFYDDYTHVRAFSRVGLQRLLEDAGFEDLSIEGYTPPLKTWQRPISMLASRAFPFLWRAVARRELDHA